VFSGYEGIKMFEKETIISDKGETRGDKDKDEDILVT
jgi:hypothetical protein